MFSLDGVSLADIYAMQLPIDLVLIGLLYKATPMVASNSC